MRRSRSSSPPSRQLLCVSALCAGGETPSERPSSSATDRGNEFELELDSSDGLLSALAGDRHRVALGERQTGTSAPIGLWDDDDGESSATASSVARGERGDVSRRVRGVEDAVEGEGVLCQLGAAVGTERRSRRPRRVCWPAGRGREGGRTAEAGRGGRAGGAVVEEERAGAESPCGKKPSLPGKASCGDAAMKPDRSSLLERGRGGACASVRTRSWTLDESRRAERVLLVTGESRGDARTASCARRCSSSAYRFELMGAAATMRMGPRTLAGLSRRAGVLLGCPNSTALATATSASSSLSGCARRTERRSR